MRSIEEIRKALSQIEGGRFAISNAPPPFRRRQRPTTNQVSERDGSVWTGLEIVPSPETDRNIDSDREDVEGYFRSLDDEVATQGVDALAWYVSFHNTNDEWGIYIPVTSMHYLSDRLFAKTRLDLHQRIEVALQLILNHERFHFAADYAQTQVELLLGKPCRKALKSRYGAGQYLEIEEALANAFMLKGVRKLLTKANLQRVRSFIERQPPGYRDANRYADDDVLFSHGLSEVVKSYAGIPALLGNPTLPIASIDWSLYFSNLRCLDWRQCPVHFINDEFGGMPSVVPKFLSSIPDIRETKKFLKKLQKLSKHFQDAWQRKKEELASRPPNQKQFEALSGDKAGLYSVRVGGGHRAHLKPVNRFEYWEALMIGTHTEMGHD